MGTTFEMESYYNQRAQEYENIYQIEDRQEDIRNLSQLLKESLSQRHTIEIACGTGFWTEIIASSTKSILASDQSLETLQIARAKNLHSRSVQFIQDDAYSLEKAHGTFDAAFAGFWWSHIPIKRIPEFLTNLHGKLLPGSTILFFDNQYVEGKSTAISRTDSEGNTYQIRKLMDGTTHEIIKNFPTDEDLEKALAGIAINSKIHRWKYYWAVEYQTCRII